MSVVDYYQRLLRIQGRAEEAGYVSQYEWATTQRMIWSGAIAGEIGGLLAGSGIAAFRLGRGFDIAESAGKSGLVEAPGLEPVRPTPRASEVDVGIDLGSQARPQVSFKDGVEVIYGTLGSVRPDWCLGNICSIEVKNYNLSTNQSGLIDNVSRQAVQRSKHLPDGMQQQVVIDVRGQSVTVEQERAIIRRIVEKSAGAIDPDAIEFKRN